MIPSGGCGSEAWAVARGGFLTADSQGHGSSRGMDNPTFHAQIANESVHCNHQKLLSGPDAWWQRSIDDPQFRLIEELPAYRAVYLVEPDPRRLIAEGVDHSRY